MSDRTGGSFVSPAISPLQREGESVCVCKRETERDTDKKRVCLYMRLRLRIYHGLTEVYNQTLYHSIYLKSQL